MPQWGMEKALRKNFEANVKTALDFIQKKPWTPVTILDDKKPSLVLLSEALYNRLLEGFERSEAYPPPRQISKGESMLIGTDEDGYDKYKPGEPVFEIPKEDMEFKTDETDPSHWKSLE